MDRGAWIGTGILFSWSLSLWFLFQVDISVQYWSLALIPLQMHLYTGLFITAHDAMHGVASKNPGLNLWLGRVACALYAAFDYRKLHTQHHAHHRHVATAADPDYYDGNFWEWYLQFIRHYINWKQLVILALVFNLLHYAGGIAQPNLLLFWVLPSVLSTFQLFYFGTYLPHRHPELIENEHKARSQSKNHIWGFLSCYFFGYHYEHHARPWLPWWALWKA